MTNFSTYMKIKSWKNNECLSTINEGDGLSHVNVIAFNDNFKISTARSLN